jgi:hypothetical protein
MIKAKRPQVKIQLDRPDDTIGTDTSDEEPKRTKGSGPGKQASIFE